MSNQINQIDLTANTDFDLNDLPDRVSFTPWPKGVYSVNVETIEDDSREYGDGNIVPGIVFKVSLNEVLEVAAATETSDIPAPGAIQEWFFARVGKDENSTRRSQGEIKNLGTPFAIACGSAKYTDWAAAAKGMNIILVTNLTKKVNKETRETRAYSNIVSVAIPE